jgi:hypothetical protein
MEDIDEYYYFADDESLVTNFDRGYKDIMQKAIELSGHLELHITDDATDAYGNKLPSCLALRCKEFRILNDFWDIYDQLLDEFLEDY